MSSISLTTAKEVFYLDEDSPSGLRWNIDKFSGAHGHIQSIFKDSVAGNENKTYWTVTYNYIGLLVHRIVFMLANDVESNEVEFVDHKDGNGHNNVLANLRNSGPKLNSRNKKLSSLNKTGTSGVFITTTKGKKYARAQWYDIAGKRRTKNFSFSLYGEVGAWEMALATRNQALEDLQSKGAGYTDRHGKSLDKSQAAL